MQFVWSDDLARLLVDEGEAAPAEVAHWATAIVGHRLPDDTSPFEFARRLLRDESAPPERLAG